MTTAWVIMITHLEQARYDLSLITDQTIPEWVDGAVSRMLISPHATTIHDLFVLCCTDLRHRHHLLVIHGRDDCLSAVAARLLLGHALLVDFVPHQPPEALVRVTQGELHIF
tara:strand:+ start:9072 stop:9407 length:336 start_codon:yes stop_codon:yes gene_type:complete